MKIRMASGLLFGSFSLLLTTRAMQIQTDFQSATSCFLKPISILKKVKKSQLNIFHLTWITIKDKIICSKLMDFIANARIVRGIRT